MNMHLPFTGTIIHARTGFFRTLPAFARSGFGPRHEALGTKASAGRLHDLRRPVEHLAGCAVYWERATGHEIKPFESEGVSWSHTVIGHCAVAYWRIPTATGLIISAMHLAAPDPDPEDGFEEEPDPDPEDENEADQNADSTTTRLVPDSSARGGDGTINPPFP